MLNITSICCLFICLNFFVYLFTIGLFVYNILNHYIATTAAAIRLFVYFINNSKHQLFCILYFCLLIYLFICLLFVYYICSLFVYYLFVFIYYLFVFVYYLFVFIYYLFVFIYYFPVCFIQFFHHHSNSCYWAAVGLF